MIGNRISGFIASAALTALLAGCVTAGQQANAPVAPAMQSATAATPMLAAAAPKVDDRVVRIAIARMLESSRAFRSIRDGGAPKLYDAKLVGPYETTSIFGKKAINYCAIATIETALYPMTAQGFITIEKDPAGKVRINARIPISGVYVPCPAGAQPFPELERARNLRRRALGKSSA